MGKVVRRRIGLIVLTCIMLSPSALLATDAAVTVTKEQAGQEVALKVGNILLIELPTQGGTGYLWSLEAPGAPHLNLLCGAAKKVGEPRPGSSMIQVWRFEAAQPGNAEIKLAYYRPWEGVGEAVDHFHLKLHID